MEEKKPRSYVKLFTKDEVEHAKKFYTSGKTKYMRVGPAGYVLPTAFLNLADEIRNMPLRSDDVFVASYTRSGTTWTQELVWLIVNDLDYEKAKSIPLHKRYEFLEFCVLYTPEELTDECDKDETLEKLWEELAKPATEVLNTTTSQRFIKTHLPLSLLPTATLDTAKVVYVARDVRDVAVSMYHFHKSIKYFGIVCDFKQYYENMFSKDMTCWSPYFDHLKEAWAVRDHPNMLFLFYEDLSKDLKTAAQRVADFFGKQYTDKQLDQLCRHLAFDNFKKNKAVNLETDLEELKQLGIFEDKKINFIRKGKAGGWRDHFDEEMTRHAENWIAEELGRTGMQQFPLYL